MPRAIVRVCLMPAAQIEARECFSILPESLLHHPRVRDDGSHLIEVRDDGPHLIEVRDDGSHLIADCLLQLPIALFQQRAL